MTGSDLASWFHMTFHGFAHAWGESGDHPRTIWEDLTLAHFRRHLDGEAPLGIYPMVYDPTNKHVGPRGWDTNRRYPDMRPELWVCAWGCIDIDAQSDSHKGQGTEDEVADYAFSLVVVLAAQSIPAWVERTRSGGAHVWVFPDTWCSTSDMRRCLQAAEQIAGVPTDSPFPKSESLPGPPGNFVRLPYYGNRARMDRQVVIEPDGAPVPLEGFLHDANANRAKVADIKAAALLKAPPPPVSRPLSHESRRPPTVMRGSLKEMFEKGPPPEAFIENQGAGRGRHGWLYKFAAFACRDGYPLGTVVSWLVDLDDRFTRKFYYNGQPQPDQHRQLQHLAEKAFQDAEAEPRARLYR